ncbi:hypothetical protein BY996DRAFT_6408991 [Phakopsora pachyrhizi]|nr:hypothetical protein BY996DRAFT_6408991 [Phakopsora pachyrhizi]
MYFLMKTQLLCLATYRLKLTDAGFPKINQITALRDVVDDSNFSAPLGDQEIIFSQTNTFQYSLDPLKGKRHKACLTTDLVTNPMYTNHRRTFSEAFKNEGGELNREPITEEKRPRRIPDNLKVPHFLPPLQTDLGDDLEVSTAEWDDVQNKLLASQPTEFKYNYSPTFENLKQNHFYFSDGGFWEAYDELINQPNFYENMHFNKATESKAFENFNLAESSHTKNLVVSKPVHFNEADGTQVQENRILGESSITDNLILSGSSEPEPTKRIVDKSLKALEKKLQHDNLDETGKTHGEIQSLYSPSGDFGTLHQITNLKDKQKNKVSKTQSKAIEIVETPRLNKKNQSHVSLVRNKKGLPKEINRSQCNKNTLVVLESQPYKALKRSENLFKIELSVENMIGPQKSLKEILDEFKLELERLKKVGLTESSLVLFAKTMDRYADSKPDDFNPDPRGRKIHKVLESHPRFFACTKLFFAHDYIPINRYHIEFLNRFLQENPDAEFRRSSQNFLNLIYHQIAVNGYNILYIPNDQVYKFLKSSPDSDFKVKISNFNTNILISNTNDYADKLGQIFNKAVKSEGIIHWKDIFTSDNKIKKFVRREYILRNKKFPSLPSIYVSFINKRFTLRKLFLVYSTIINKIFCSGEIDLLENFHNRQKDAINFFDNTLELLKFDEKDTSIQFIENNELPLEKETKDLFLETYNSCFISKNKLARFQIGTGRSPNFISARLQIQF